MKLKKLELLKMRNAKSGRNPQFKLVRPGKTYQHSWRIKHWLVRKEKSFEVQNSENVKWQQDLMECHLEKCLSLAGKNQA